MSNMKSYPTAKTKALAAEMQEEEPDAGWEAMNGKDE